MFSKRFFLKLPHALYNIYIAPYMLVERNLDMFFFPRLVSIINVRTDILHTQHSLEIILQHTHTQKRWKKAQRFWDSKQQQKKDFFFLHLISFSRSLSAWQKTRISFHVREKKKIEMTIKMSSIKKMSWWKCENGKKKVFSVFVFFCYFFF